MEKLLVIEWTAALLSMSGAMALSLKIKRILEVVAWPLWITSCILLTGQNKQARAIYEHLGFQEQYVVLEKSL